MTPEAENLMAGWPCWDSLQQSVLMQQQVKSFQVFSNRKRNRKGKGSSRKLNGRLAMLGIIAGLGAYLTTGQIIPGFV